MMWLTMAFLQVLSLLFWTTSIPTVQGFQVLPTQTSSVARASFTGGLRLLTSLSLSSSSDDGDGDDAKNNSLLDRASKLRQEAEQLQQQVAEKRLATATSAPPAILPLQIMNLNDSVWTLPYRFSSQPQEENENDDDKDVIIYPNYSGTLTVKLKGDGYSELMSHESRGNQLVIDKIWGWDQEDSQKDDDKNSYLLLSMDVTLPETDPKLAGEKKRYYFQARIDQDVSDKAISLQEGTITVKQDISAKTNGVWGLFSVAGILTQFRYVGDFSARPSKDPI